MRPLVEVLTRPQFERNTCLLEELCAVVREDYVSSAALLREEVAFCDFLYTARDCGNQLRAFIFAKRHSLEIGERWEHAVYIGLAGAQSSDRGGDTSLLPVLKLIQEIDAWQKTAMRRFAVWSMVGTTAGYLFSRRLAPSLEPALDGSHTTLGLGVVAGIRRFLGAVGRPGDHPFVMRGICRGAELHEREKERSTRIGLARGLGWFNQLGVDTGLGDQMLVVSTLPGPL